MNYFSTLVKGEKYQLGDKIYRKGEKTEVNKSTYDYFKNNKQFECVAVEEKELEKALEQEPEKEAQDKKEPKKASSKK